MPLVEAVTYLFMAVEAGGALALSIMCVVVTSTFLSSYLMTRLYSSIIAVRVRGDGKPSKTGE